MIAERESGFESLQEVRELSANAGEA